MALALSAEGTLRVRSSATASDRESAGAKALSYSAVAPSLPEGRNG